MPEISGMIQNYLEGSIKTIGRAPVIQSKSITENGTYTAPEGVDGYSPITVNVPIPEPSLAEQVCSHNGTYLPPEGYDGFSKVEVDVPIPTMDDITITENGTYLPASYNLGGFDQVVVNVPSIAKKIFNNNATKFNEASMNIVFGLDSFNVVWSGSSSIGAQVYGLVNLRGYSKITVNAYAGTSWYWTYSQQDNYKLVFGLSSVMATNPSQVTPIVNIKSAPLNENFTMELNIPNDTDCYMYFVCSGFNLNNVQIEVI